MGGNSVLIDNRLGVYKSCAEAYNLELKKKDEILGDILIFCHQDIAFENKDFILRIINELNDNPNQILGFAGMPANGRTISNLRYLVSKQYITRTQLMVKTEVCSLDECCFAMTKELYKKIRFDEHTCTHWHLYAVDFCYDARRKLGVKSYVLPENIYHKYDGTKGLYTDGKFLYTIWRMTRKYYKDYTMIYTPCYIVSTSFIPCVTKIAKTLVRNIITSMKRYISTSFLCIL